MSVIGRPVVNTSVQALVSIVLKIVGEAGLGVDQIDTERVKSHLNKRYGLERRATTDAVKAAALIALGHSPATLPSRKQLTKSGLAALTGTCGRETPLPLHLGLLNPPVSLCSNSKLRS